MNLSFCFYPVFRKAHPFNGFARNNIISMIATNELKVENKFGDVYQNKKEIGLRV